MKNVMLLFDEIENSENYKKVLVPAIKNNFNIKVESIDFASGFSSEKPTMNTTIFDFLHEFAEPTFLVTSKPIMHFDGLDFVYLKGAVHNEYNRGFVSCFDVPSENLETILKMTLHEIGHTLGLTHHDRSVGLGGKYCFMRQKPYDVEWNDYVKDTSKYLCGKCKKDLGIPSFKRRNRF